MPRPRSERRSPWPAVVLVGLLLLAVLYVVSTGPITWLYAKKWISDEEFIATVRPASRAAALSDVTDDIFTQYVRWWFKAGGGTTERLERDEGL